MSILPTTAFIPVFQTEHGKIAIPYSDWNHPVEQRCVELTKGKLNAGTNIAKSFKKFKYEGETLEVPIVLWRGDKPIATFFAKNIPGWRTSNLNGQVGYTEVFTCTHPSPN